MGFRTAYKVIFERAYNQRHFETSYICANADKMNAFGICWFLILPWKIHNKLNSEGCLYPRISYHGLRISTWPSMPWGEHRYFLETPINLSEKTANILQCHLWFTYQINEVWEMSDTLARYSCDTTQIWVVFLNGWKFDLTNQKRSNRILVVVISWLNQRWHCKMSAVLFLGYILLVKINENGDLICF